MKVLKRIIIGIVAVIVIIIIAFYAYLKSTLPEYDGEITIQGLKDKVEIIRDSYGMPHIYARNDQDASFAIGYCMAQDRLFHMDIVRRAATGRLSEILGKALIPVDKLFRTITAGKSAEEMVSEYPPEIVSAVNAYTAGVNYYLENHDEPLPVEFTILGYKPEPWKASDGAAVIYYMAWDLNSAFNHELLHSAIIDKFGEKMAQDLFSDYVEGYPTIIPKVTSSLDFLKTLNLARKILGAEGGASNNWVVSGKKSKSGMPLLANDPHLGHGAPGIWYEAHIVTPSMNVSGVYLPGSPYAIIGANEHVAWGFTNVMADDADFYIEKINPDNPDKYLYKGQWEDMKIKDEVIKVKGGEDVKFKIRITRHGPIINDVQKKELKEYAEEKGITLSMKWAVYENSKTVKSFQLANRAMDIDDIEKAIEYFKCPGQNWVYADDKGNIGYWAAVAIPVRKGFSGMLPVPGWDGKHEWNGYMPTEMQPHMRNPSRGWIATANNKHTGDDYPYPISHYYAMPDRFVRIQEMLTEKEKFEVKDFTKMHLDFYMILAREWLPIMEKALSGKELSEMEKKAFSVLKDWNFVAKKEYIAPTIFHATINNMIKNTYKKRLGDEFYKLYLKNQYTAFNSMRKLINRGKSIWFDDPDTKEVEGIDEVILKSFKEAVVYLDKEMGSNVDNWIWGKLHTLTMYHPFGRSSRLMGFFMNIGPFSMGGSISTVNPQPYKITNPWGGYHGASLRYIIDFSNRENSRRIIPTGISGNFMSPYYSDQAELWSKGLYRPFVLDRKNIEKDVQHTLNLLP